MEDLIAINLKKLKKYSPDADGRFKAKRRDAKVFIALGWAKSPSDKVGDHDAVGKEVHAKPKSVSGEAHKKKDHGAKPEAHKAPAVTPVTATKDAAPVGAPVDANDMDEKDDKTTGGSAE